MKIGDRFKWIDDFIAGPIFCSEAEVISDTECIVIKGTSIGETFASNFIKVGDVRLWRFIGNFAKSRNFSNLYDILNEK